MRRLPTIVLLSALAFAGLAGTGCAPQTSMPFTAEIDDPEYRRGKDLVRMGRDADALKQFLKVIDQRGGAAAESHLEAGILYHKHIKDPISAIYHYRRYRELRPNTEQARLVLQSIEACIRDFARTLPAQPLDNQVERTDLLDTIDRMQRENLQLKEQLAAARAAVLDVARQPGAAASPQVGGGFALTEPSQGGFTPDLGAGLPPQRDAGALEYSAPMGVAPISTPPPNVQPVTPPQQQATPPAVRRHTVAKGDTLSSISLRYYGNRTRWRDIFAANRDILPSESALRIGMELKIPE